jgi:class 3 adenylate cyclase
MGTSRTADLRALHDAIKAIGGCNDRSAASRVAVDRLANTLAVSDAAVWSLARGLWRLEACTRMVDTELSARPVDVHCVVRRGRALSAEEVLEHPPHALHGWCFAPMEVEGVPWGMIGAARPTSSLGEVELELLCSIASITAVTLAQIQARDTAVDAERRRLRMSRYLAPQVARYIDRSGRDRCPPVRHDATVLLADIRSFTTMSEGRDPAAVVAFLDGYFERMVAIIDEHGGVVDKLLGDGLLAVFGAPDPRPDHAAAGVGAARQMIAAAPLVPGRPDGRSEPIRIGVGLHSGEVVSGDVGGNAFLDFTIIGSTVNIAARVEEQTKVLGRAALATAATIDRLPPSDRPAWSREVRLRGIENAVRLYAVDEP